MSFVDNVIVIRWMIVISAIAFTIVNGVAILRRKRTEERAFLLAQIFPLLYVAFHLANPKFSRGLGGINIELAIFMILVTGLAERIMNNE